MKNFKQIAFGLLVGAMAIGFSAFTNAKTSAQAEKNLSNKRLSITSNFVIQPSLDSFQQLATGADPAANCSGTSDRECTYDVTTSGKTNIPNQASYTKAEIDNYVSHSWLTPDPDSSPALY